MSTKNTNRQPQAALANPAPVTEQEAAQATVGNIGEGISRETLDAGLARFRGQVSDPKGVAAAKSTLLGSVRQTLAEAIALYQAGDENEAEVSGLTSKAIMRLRDGRIAGLLQPEEVTATLGDLFGWRPKKDGTPSKTPEKRGSYIRMRVVRFVAADDYINGRGNPEFFEGLDKDEVAAIVAEVESGEITATTGYEKFGKLKSANNERTPAAFNPKAIVALVAALTKETKDSVIQFVNNPALGAAYGALIDAVAVIGANMPEPEGEGE